MTTKLIAENRTGLAVAIAAAVLTFTVSACSKPADDAGSQAGSEQVVEEVEVVEEVATVTTDSGLMYEVLESGDGATPAETDKVTVHYRGTLEDGTEFDSSHKRGQPAQFPVNRVIRGWTEALQLMQEGDKWRLTIPPDLAYGSRGAGAKIPPNATLIFEVELIKVN